MQLLFDMEFMWTSPICPHKEYDLSDPEESQRRLTRLGPFFRIILGLDQTRVKQVQGIWIGPKSRTEFLQYRWGTREPQRCRWICRIPDEHEERLFEFLVILKMMWEKAQNHYISSEDWWFLDELTRRLIETKRVMGPFRAKLLRRKYLLTHWRIFRAIGKDLIKNKKRLNDVMRVWRMFRICSCCYLPSVVKLFLSQ